MSKSTMGSHLEGWGKKFEGTPSRQVFSHSTRKEIRYEKLLESLLIMGQTQTLEKFRVLLLIISIVLLKVNRKSFKIYYSND